MSELRNETWNTAVGVAQELDPALVATIRSGDPARLRALSDHDLTTVCAFACTALGEAAYLLATIKADTAAAALPPEPVPQTRAQLKSYLERHPNLQVEYPAGVLLGRPEGFTEGRTYIGVERPNTLVFRTPSGEPSYAAGISSKQLSFFPDRFELSFPPSFKTDKRIIYRYLPDTEELLQELNEEPDPLPTV